MSKQPEAAKPTYESPTVAIVGEVSELTAGPITKYAETSGGFHGRGGERTPRTEDGDE